MWIGFKTRGSDNIKVNLDYVTKIIFDENKIWLIGADFTYRIYEDDNEDFHIIMRKLKSL